MQQRSKSGLRRVGPTIRNRLDRLTGLFQWLYEKSADTAMIRRGFYLVMMGMTEGEVIHYDPKSLERYAEMTRGWDWTEFRRRVRGKIERALEQVWQGKTITLPHLKRIFGNWDIGIAKGFMLGYFPRRNAPYASLPELILLQAAEDLAGFDASTVTRCEMCGALTVRKRDKEKQYCSSKCRWQAIAEQRRAQRVRLAAQDSKRHPRSSVKGKGANHEPNRNA